MTPSVDTAAPRARGARRWLPYALLALLILFHAACNAVWLQQDGRSLYGDPGNHARASMAIYEILRDPSPDLLLRINRATTFWPPLAYLLTQPLYLVFGVSTDVTNFTTTLWFALAIVVTFLIGRRLYDQRAGLLAAFLFSFYPAVYLQSRTYYVDMALTAAVLVALYCLLRTEAFRRRGASLVFGLALGLAALTKNAFIVMTVGPVLAVALIALFSGGLASWRELLRWQPGQRPAPAAADLVNRLLNMALAAGIVVALAAPWYLSHAGILAFNAGEVTRDVHLANKPVAWYPLKFDEALLIWPYLLLLMGLLVGLWRWRRNWFALLWLVSGVAIITMITRQNVRYLLPVLPAAALLSASWIAALRRPALRRALIGVTALFQVALFFVMSWGAPAAWNQALAVPVQNAHNPFNDNVADRPIAIDPLAFLYYQYPPRPHRWPVEEITAAVVEDIERSGRTHQLNRFVSLSKLLDFEYSTFAYETELARAQRRPGAANLLMGDVPQRPTYLTDVLDFDYLLVKSNDRSTVAGRVNHRATRELWNSGDPVLRSRFALVQRWELHDGSVAELYRRTAPPLAMLSPQELRPVLQHVLELTPENQFALRWLALLDAAEPAWQLNNAVQLWRGVVSGDPNNGVAWEKLIDALLVIDPPAALAEVQQAGQLRDLLPATRLLLQRLEGRAWEGLGDAAQAEAAYRAAVQMAPDDDASQAALAAFYLRQGRLEEAQALYGALAARRGQEDAAAETPPAEQPGSDEPAAETPTPTPTPEPEPVVDLETMLAAQAEAAPGDAATHLWLGALALQQGAPVDAAAGHFQRAIDLAMQAEPPDRAAGLAYALWANDLGNSGQIDRAMQIVEQGLAALPADPSLQAMQTRWQGAPGADEAYRAALEAARGASQERRWEDAVAAAQQAIDQGAAGYEAQIALGDAYRGQGDLDRALRAYQAAAELAPTLSILHSRQAEMLARLGRVEEAVAASLDALAIDQGRWENWYGLGLAYRALALNVDADAAPAFAFLPTQPAGAARAAEAFLQRAQALAPAGNQAPNRALAELRAAVSVAAATPEPAIAAMSEPARSQVRAQAEQALHDGQPAEALALFQQLAAADRRDRASRMGAANALAELGRVDEALAELAAISLDWPDFPFAHIRQGALLEEQGYPEAALAAYREAVRVAPDNADAHFTLAYALQRAGQRTEAIAAFEAGLALDPGRAAARQALDELLAAGP